MLLISQRSTAKKLRAAKQSSQPRHQTKTPKTLLNRRPRNQAAVFLRAIFAVSSDLGEVKCERTPLTVHAIWFPERAFETLRQGAIRE